MTFEKATALSMIALSGLLTIVGAGRANADLVCGSGVCTASAAIAEQPTELGSASAPLTVSLPLFNSALGTLTGVNVSISGTLYTLAGSSVNNSPDATAPQSFTAKEDSQFFISDSSRPSSSLALALSNEFFALYLDPSAQQSYSNLAPGASAAFGPFTKVGSATLANSGGSAGLPALSLADMQADGGGSDTLSVYTLTSSKYTGGGGNVGGVFKTDGALNVSVTYDYTADVVNAPEPASLALLGAGLTCLGVIRRRRTR